jgi:hypothetical protein
MVAAVARYAAERELFVAAELAAAASGSNKLVASFLPAPQGLDQPESQLWGDSGRPVDESLRQSNRPYRQHA